MATVILAVTNKLALAPVCCLTINTLVTVSTVLRSFTVEVFTYKITTGFIKASLSKIQGLLKTILQFSRTKRLAKILI